MPHFLHISNNENVCFFDLCPHSYVLGRVFKSVDGWVWKEGGEEGRGRRGGGEAASWSSVIFYTAL